MTPPPRQTAGAAAMRPSPRQLGAGIALAVGAVGVIWWVATAIRAGTPLIAEQPSASSSTP